MQGSLGTLSLPDPGQSWDALLGDLGQGFLDAVPGGYYMGESQLAWQGGNYFSSGLLFVGALAEALMSAATGGETTGLLNTMRAGRLVARGTA